MNVPLPPTAGSPRTDRLRRQLLELDLSKIRENTKYAGIEVKTTDIPDPARGISHPIWVSSLFHHCHSCYWCYHHNIDIMNVIVILTEPPHLPLSMHILITPTPLPTPFIIPTIYLSIS